MAAGVVIIGAGQAGLQAAVELRAAGYSEPIRLVGAERALPYHRPPLSKAYLTGEKGPEALMMRAEAFYAEQAIEPVLDDPCIEIDRARRRVVLQSGRSLPWSRLVLATGARARRLGGEGTDLDGVVVLRTRDDADALKWRLDRAAAMVVVGGGFIGLEAAASAAKLGKQVTVLEMQPRLMARAVGEPISAHFLQAHRSHGVDVRLGDGVARILGVGGRVTGVETTSGQRIACEIVLVGIGVIPNTELAAAANIETGDGILVDRQQRSSDADVLALGDCASFPDPRGSGRLRLESVQNAVDQAKIVAASILGRDAAYAAVPWFWSDQYDLKLQMVGLSTGHDAVVLRGAAQDNRFSAFYFRDGRLIAIDSVNRPTDHMRGRKLLADGMTITPADLDTHFPDKSRG
jgi:3-phenylpropionate/trans-cinnamate dioxygenase ferredoxin reductase subunit